MEETGHLQSRSVSPLPADAECTYCNIRFLDRDYYENHMRFHGTQLTANEDYKLCEHCGSRFVSSLALGIHLTAHSGKLRDSVSETVNNALMESTQSIDIGEISEELRVVKDSDSNYEESDTDSNSSGSSQTMKTECLSPSDPYIRCQMIHERKTYTCILCQKIFTKLFKIQEHIQIHTGQLPFKCTLCDKSFTKLRRLYVHSRIVHNWIVDVEFVNRVETKTAPNLQKLVPAYNNRESRIAEILTEPRLKVDRKAFLGVTSRQIKKHIHHPVDSTHSNGYIDSESRIKLSACHVPCLQDINLLVAKSLKLKGERSRIEKYFHHPVNTTHSNSYIVSESRIKLPACHVPCLQDINFLVAKSSPLSTSESITKINHPNAPEAVPGNQDTNLDANIEQRPLIVTPQLITCVPVTPSDQNLGSLPDKHLRTTELDCSSVSLHCPETLPTETTLTNHGEEIYAPEPVLCPYGSESFYPPSKLGVHLSTVHKLDNHNFTGLHNERRKSRLAVRDTSPNYRLISSPDITPTLPDHTYSQAHLLKNAPKFSCIVCGKTFADFVSMDCHKTKDHRIDTFLDGTNSQRDILKLVCIICSKLLPSINSLNHHQYRDHKWYGRINRSSRCEYCHAWFKSSRVVYKHRSTHRHKIRMNADYPCLDCGKRFLAPTALGLHKRSEHFCMDPIPKNPRKKQGYKCEHCPLFLPTAPALLDHVSKQHTIANLLYTPAVKPRNQSRVNPPATAASSDAPANTTCSSAWEGSSWDISPDFLSTLALDSVSVLQSQDQAESNQRRKKSYRLFSKPIRHQRLNHPKVRFQFPKRLLSCNSETRSKLAYQKHMYRHRMLKDFPCKKCGKRFISVHNLRKHDCLANFDFDSSFDVISSSLRPFESVKSVASQICKYCSKSFRFESNCRNHEKRHKYKIRNSKDFPCDLCPKRFLNISSCKNHQALEHNTSAKEAFQPDPVEKQSDRVISATTVPVTLKLVQTIGRNGRKIGYKCNFCDLYLPSRDDRDSHKIRMHAAACQCEG